MRGKGSIAAACAGLALLTSGCNLLLEEKLIALGIGTDLPVEDIAEDTRRLDTYFNYLCRQAGMARFEGEGELVCDMTRYGNASLTLIVRAGFNDIDRRCDSYLAWLNSRRRNRSAILSQIHDTRTFTEALLYTTGVGAAPIAIAGLAFGLASNTFTNYYSRLLLEIEKSTVEMLVTEKRLEYRDKLKGQIAFQPDAVHVLREYLLICTPHSIENRINQRARDSVAGNMPADRNHAEQIRKSVVATDLLRSIPGGGARGKLGGVGGQDGGLQQPTMTGGLTDSERRMSITTGQIVQGNLCVSLTGDFDRTTREAIRQAKIGARQSRLHIQGAPAFNNVTNQLMSATEAQIFSGAGACNVDFLGNNRNYEIAFEKFRFPNEDTVKIFQERLKKCKGVTGVTETGVFDKPTRDAILKTKNEADEQSKQGFASPGTGRVNDKVYEYISFSCT